MTTSVALFAKRAISRLVHQPVRWQVTARKHSALGQVVLEETNSFYPCQKFMLWLLRGMSSTARDGSEDLCTSGVTISHHWGCNLFVDLTWHSRDCSNNVLSLVLCLSAQFLASFVKCYVRKIMEVGLFIFMILKKEVAIYWLVCLAGLWLQRVFKSSKVCVLSFVSSHMLLIDVMDVYVTSITSLSHNWIMFIAIWRCWEITSLNVHTLAGAMILKQ